MIAHCENLILHHPPYGFTQSIAGEIIRAADWPQHSFEQTIRKISSLIFFIFAQLPALVLDLLMGGAATAVKAFRIRWPGVNEAEHLRDSIRLALAAWPDGPQKQHLREAIKYVTLDRYDPFQIVAEWSISLYLEKGQLPRFLAALRPLKNGQTIAHLASSFGKLSQTEQMALLAAVRTQKEPSEAGPVWSAIRSFASHLHDSPAYITAYKKHLVNI